MISLCLDDNATHASIATALVALEALQRQEIDWNTNLQRCALLSHNTGVIAMEGHDEKHTWALVHLSIGD